ncbi:hypothetical protein MVES1_000738 [Malassezia vespertilionis]|uniref:glutathione-specific gamma-glutamylcyclotransferase n=1 Tax=Malassezia vespertilionis TaxID=2020962 RepID=A0A2N1JFV2_9BASI|nr:uncharacterized protein MVES1_000738 [Malassezia vespertilionis]PKI85422.1 hypothetical protein MVES_000694 [Malassezia vespertilionis]WFD05408.1 hypothetical protein MVES1_000738 [Malassezia vespertilionis]
MGAGQSAEAPQETEEAFVDYYALLEVEQTDVVEQIRKSYRKLALRFHPDKNPGDEEAANKKFSKLQEAYEVLSDDTERAWYDQNRERLMHGGTDEDDGDETDIDAKFKFFRSGGAPPKATSAAPGIGVSHLLRFYEPNIAKDLSDADSSFYGTYRRLFKRLAEEDRIAAPYPGEAHEGGFSDPDRDDELWYPSFGDMNTPYTSSGTHGDNVRKFYQFWTQFSSRKSFSWKDKYDLRDAPDRRVKRMIEKDNKRARDAARREYNETIRGLAVFIRRRDPRYKAFQAEQSQSNSQETSADAKARREAEVKKRLQEKRAQAATFEAQNWQKANAPEDDWASDFTSGESHGDNEALHDMTAVEGEHAFSDEELLFDCVACSKRFQSRAAWENHERGKKHKKEMQRLQREMREDDLALCDDLEEMRIETDDAAELEPDDPVIPPLRKKDKKKKKLERKFRATLHEDKDSDGAQEFTEAPSSEPNTGPTACALFKNLPHVATLPKNPERPPGSFDVFGYGSLIFKPPPHVIGYTPGYIEGFSRRFAQHSIDHRGTPENPGRVVTLVKASDWLALPGADLPPEADIVWGISYTIDPVHAEEVRAYLDHREKNGYTPMTAPIWDILDGNPVMLMPEALVYVGLPENEAFIGPEPLDALAERIYTSQGPSGRNDEYLFRLAEAVRALTPNSADNYLFSLEEKVAALQAKGAAPDTKTDKKRAGDKFNAKCNVCNARFASRSKLFAHVREEGHASAIPQPKKNTKKRK